MNHSAGCDALFTAGLLKRPEDGDVCRACEVIHEVRSEGWCDGYDSGYDYGVNA
jgi:hypothetical protein